MKALVAPDPETAFRYYEEIVAAKQTGVDVDHLRDRVEAAYSSYWQHRSVLERLSPLPALTPAERKLLRGLYSSKARAVKPLRGLMAAITGRQERNARAVCQHCGIGEPNTFDHYLPQHIFHEFSVCSLNLVPCCDVCNVGRGKRTWCCDGERTSLHLYFDEINVDVAFVEADVLGCAGGEFYVKYRLDEDSADEFARRYRRHCKTLNLLERFGTRATGELDVIGAEIATINLGGVEAVAEHFRIQALAMTPILGANNWEVALRHAVSRAHDFIDHALREE